MNHLDCLHCPPKNNGQVNIMNLYEILNTDGSAAAPGNP
jgi:hypothetical protein